MRGLAWDMDGTLVNTEPLWSIATYEMAELMGNPLSVAERAETVGGTADHTVTYCLAHSGQSATPEKVATWKNWLFERMGGDLRSGN